MRTINSDLAEKIKNSQLSEIQKTYLELIAKSSFNCFDGNQVVNDLLSHQELWVAAIMAREGCGITLRDLPTNCNNVDTLYLTTRQVTSLKKLAKTWKADAIAPIEDASHFLGSYPAKLKILQIWWD